jgi:hypothetical protein
MHNASHAAQPANPGQGPSQQQRCQACAATAPHTLPHPTWSASLLPLGGSFQIAMQACCQPNNSCMFLHPHTCTEKCFIQTHYVVQRDNELDRHTDTAAHISSDCQVTSHIPCSQEGQQQSACVTAGVPVTQSIKQHPTPSTPLLNPARPQQANGRAVSAVLSSFPSNTEFRIKHACSVDFKLSHNHTARPPLRPDAQCTTPHRTDQGLHMASASKQEKSSS